MRPIGLIGALVGRMGRSRRSRHQIATIWGTEDVREVRPDLSDGQAWRVLRLCERRMDCDLGLTWALIELAADELFPE